MQTLGIVFDTCREINDKERVAFMQKYGFTATFLMSNDEQLASRAALLREASIKIDNCHAPFDGINNMWQPTTAGDEMLLRLTESLENCARYEIPILIVHISSGETPPRVGDVGLSRFDALIDRANALGVTVAFENQRKLGNLALFMEYYPKAGFCFDTGHEACFTPGREYMPLFGNRMIALHLHDNSAVYNADDHILPYDGKVDLARAARQIAASPYTGTIMSESFKTDFYASLTPDEYYARAEKAIRRFAEDVDFYRTQTNV